MEQDLHWVKMLNWGLGIRRSRKSDNLRFYPTTVLMLSNYRSYRVAKSLLTQPQRQILWLKKSQSSVRKTSLKSAGSVSIVTTCDSNQKPPRGTCQTCRNKMYVSNTSSSTLFNFRSTRLRFWISYFSQMKEWMNEKPWMDRHGHAVLEKV